MANGGRGQGSRDGAGTSFLAAMRRWDFYHSTICRASMSMAASAFSSLKKRTTYANKNDLSSAGLAPGLGCRQLECRCGQSKSRIQQQGTVRNGAWQLH